MCDSARAARVEREAWSLSPRGRKETDSARARTKSPLQTPACAHERVPRRGSIFRSRRGIVSGLKRKNHADGPATMRQDVRGPRLSDAPQDTSGMRFQFPDTDNALRRSGAGRVVVPHVTTLRAAPLNRQGAPIA